jgi:hypothetical protein
MRKAAATRDFNATWDEAGNRTQRVEGLLAELEDCFAQVTDLLVQGRLSATPQQLLNSVLAPDSIRQVIATFVMVQWGRTPAGREALSRPADTQLKQQVHDLGLDLADYGMRLQVPRLWGWWWTLWFRPKSRRSPPP